MKHTQIHPIKFKQQIIGYFSYVDNIFITYSFDQNNTIIEHTLNEFNNIQTSTKFTIGKRTK
jgi:hypothetical protein